MKAKVWIEGAAVVMSGVLCAQASVAQQPASIFYPLTSSRIDEISYAFRTAPQNDATGEAKATVSTLSLIVVMRREATPLPDNGAGIRVTYTWDCATRAVSGQPEAFDTNGAPMSKAAGDVVVEQISFLARLQDSDRTALSKKCTPPPPPQAREGIAVYPVSSIDAKLKAARYLKADELREPKIYTPSDAVRWTKYRDAALDRARDIAGGRYVVVQYEDTTTVVDLAHRQSVGKLTRVVVYSATNATPLETSIAKGHMMSPIFQRYSALVSCESRTAIVEDSAMVTAMGAPDSLILAGDKEYPIGGRYLGKAYAQVCDLKPSGKGLTVYSSLQAALAEANLKATTPQ